ncbi:MAG: hypothetical protein AAGF94_20185 [Pseudomonadota bacterium]
MDYWFIIILAAASMIGGRLIIKSIKKSQDKREDYQAIAQQFGWSYMREKASDNFGHYDIFSDPADDWTLKIVFISGGATHGSVTRRIDWHSPSGALPEGEAVLGAPLPEKTVSVLQSGGGIGSSLTKAAIKGTMYALGKTKFSLTLDEATAGDPGGIVLASSGQELAMNALRRNEALAQFRETRKEVDVPVIIRDDTGLTLRRPNVTHDAAELKAIVELGKDLRADL